jgi:hypothetical protein
MKCAVEPRRTPPLSVQLAVAKRQLADLMRRLEMIPVEVSHVEWELDHEPALGLRDVDPHTGRHQPHQHDASYLIWRPKVSHDVKTRGRGATTAGSDVGEMRKTRQLVRARVERGEIQPEDPSIAPWAPNPHTRAPMKREVRSAGFRPPKPKPSPCRTPDKLLSLKDRTF